MTTYLEWRDVYRVAQLVLGVTDPPVRDFGLIGSAVARPAASAFGRDAYPSLALKAAALLESLGRNHALVDGNERVAWVSTVLFLRLNGSDAVPPDVDTGEAFVVDVVQGKTSLIEIANTLARWAQ